MTQPEGAQPLTRHDCACGGSFRGSLADYLRHRRSAPHRVWSDTLAATGVWPPQDRILDRYDAYERRRA